MNLTAGVSDCVLALTLFLVVRILIMNDDPYDWKSDWFGASLFVEHPLDCSCSSWPTVGSVKDIKFTLIADLF